MARKNGELTPRQARFVEEYLVDLNATQAAIRAGYAAKDADVQGPRLLGNVGVAAAIAKGKKKAAGVLCLTRREVLREVAILAKSRIDNYVIDAAGNVTVKEGLPEDLMGAISSIKRKEWSDGEGGHTVEVELRFWNKVEPLKLAGRYKQIRGFMERVEAERPGDGKPMDVQVFTGLPKDDGPTAGTA